MVYIWINDIIDGAEHSAMKKCYSAILIYAVALKRVIT